MTLNALNNRDFEINIGKFQKIEKKKLIFREMPLDFDKIIFEGVFQNRNTINF